MIPAELRLTATANEELRALVLPDGIEHAAAISCTVVRRADRTLLIARAVVGLDDGDVATSSDGFHLEVSPIALARLAKAAAARGETLVVVHSHPFPGPVAASPIDLVTEAELCGRALRARVSRPVGALIVGPDGFDGRLWDEGGAISLDVRVAGRRTESEALSADDDERFARQVLIWGGHGQSHLARSHVVVVGAGGTGSHVAVQLAHLGVGLLTIIDDDFVEASNLSRIVGASAADVGRAKADVVAAYARRVRPDLVVSGEVASVLDGDLARHASADLVVCCTDSHASRVVLSEFVAQYAVTLVEMGVEVQPDSAGARAGGGVRIVRPGDPCLLCARVIDPALVREELLTDRERDDEADHGYLRGVGVAAPSVIALNGVVASLAVTEILNELVGMFSTAPSRLVYRSERRAVATAATVRDPECYVCGERGIVGLGDDRPLLVRRTEPRPGAG